MRSRGAPGLIGLIAAAVFVASLPVAAHASPHPIPPARGEGNRVAHPHFRVQRADTRFATEPRAQVRAALAPNPVTGGNWSSVGPTPITGEKSCCSPTSDYGKASGRITSLVTASSGTIYLGASGGGVWKSTNGGSSWSTTTDAQASIAIGSLAIDAAGTTIYAGTGENNGSGDSQRGQGILKSTDSGATWTLVGQAQFAQWRIGGLVVDQATSGTTERVFAATNNGLYVSADSGSTWANVALSPTPVAGKTASQAVDRVMQDSTGRFWITVSDFCFTEQGDVMTSSNGTSWSKSFTSGSGAMRIGLGLSANGQVAYAAPASCPNGALAGIQKNSSSGAPASWAATAAAPDYFTVAGISQGWYDNTVAVDPTNSNSAVFGGISIIATSDGGAHYTDIGQAYQGGVVHPDFHSLVFTAANTFYTGNDGGIWQGKETLFPTSVSASWTNLNANLNTIQFYTGAAIDMNHVIGGSQDNGSPGILPGSPAAQPNWQGYLDGDGGYSAIDPTPNSTVIYASTADGGIWKGSYAPPGSPDPNWPYDTFQEADPCPLGATIYPACADQNSAHVAFIAPFLMDATSPQRLLSATSKVYQSLSGGLPAGSGWSAISSDLINPAAPAPDFIASMTMGSTAATAATVISGSYFGSVYKSSNATSGSAVWTDITGNLPAFSPTAHVPGNAWISGIALNPTNTLEIWVSIGAIGVGHVWHTVNGGAAWTDISGSGSTGVPDEVADALRYDDRTGILYLATDTSVMSCGSCAGAAAPSWSTFGSGLPSVKVNGLTETADGASLIAWTHGRSAWVIPATRFPGQYRPLSPARILDTRYGPGLKVPLGNGETRSIPVAGQDGVPAMTSATPPSAVVLNVTVDNGTAPSYLTVWPTGWPRPNASNVNFVPKQTVPNLVEVALGSDGNVNVFNFHGTADVIMDVEGWISGGMVTGTDGLYRPVVPYRIADTRSGQGGTKIPPDKSLTLQVTGTGGARGVPGTGVSAVVLNVTAANPTGPGYLTVYPTGVTRPNASNVNFVAGELVPNRVQVKLSATGQITIYNFVTSSTDVIVDVNGWFTDGTDPLASGGRYTGQAPVRILDTRYGIGPQGPVGQGGTLVLQVAGQDGIPSMTSPIPPTAVVLNVTVADGTGPSFLTVYPNGVPRPSASDLNWTPGVTVPNLVVVKLGADGKIALYNLAGSVDLIVDVAGWYD